MDVEIRILFVYFPSLSEPGYPPTGGLEHKPNRFSQQRES